MEALYAWGNRLGRERNCKGSHVNGKKANFQFPHALWETVCNSNPENVPLPHLVMDQVISKSY